MDAWALAGLATATSLGFPTQAAVASLGALAPMGAAVPLVPPTPGAAATPSASPGSAAPAVVPPKAGKKVLSPSVASDLAKLGALQELNGLTQPVRQPWICSIPQGMQLDPGEATTREFMVAQAAQQAEQAQYVQQYQFWKQMKLQEAQEARASRAAGKGHASSRFRDDYRPMWLCKYMSTRGVCHKEDKCTFAHSIDELHIMSPVLPKMDGADDTALLAEQGADELNEQPDLQMKKKRDLCTQFDLGECLLGKLCPFAHGEKEIGSVGLAVSGNVKTQICQRWRDGKCLYGKLCNRAHGAHEIGLKRPPPELTKSNKRQKGESVFREDAVVDEKSRR